MLGSGSSSSFRKIIEMTARGAKALKKDGTGNTKPSLLKNFTAKGNPGAIKKSIQHVTQYGEAKKKETTQKIEDLKITGNSKKTKTKSKKSTSYSGPGDANL